MTMQMLTDAIPDIRTVSAAALIGLTAFAAPGCDVFQPSEKADTAESADPGDVAEDTAARADVADAGEPRDGAIDGGDDPSDASDAPDGGDQLGADFPMSGAFSGEAQLDLPDRDPTTHQIAATITEAAGTFRGIMRVYSTDGERERFQYVITGTLDDDRTVVDLELSARLCATDDEQTRCESGDIPDDAVFETTGEWTGEGFTFPGAELREGVPPEFAPLLESLTLAPTPGFGPGSGRRAPTGGFRPAGNDAGDAGEDEPEPLPSGKTIWSGSATNATFMNLDAPAGIDCLLELDNSDGSVELTMFACSELSLLDEPGADGEAYVVDGGFGTDNDNTAFGILVEHDNSRFLFTARRQEDLISGVILHRDHSVQPDPSPVPPSMPPESDVAGAFYFEQQ